MPAGRQASFIAEKKYTDGENERTTERNLACTIT